MRRPAAWLAALVLAALVPARSARAEDVTPAAYRTALDRTLAVVESAARRPDELSNLAHALPRSWRVDAGSQTFEIPADAIRRDLQSLARKPDAATAARVRAVLQRLRADLDDFEAPPADRSGDRARLAAILGRTEFAGVRGPTWFDRLKQRALDLLMDVLTRLVGSSNVPVVARLAVYILLGLAVLAVAWWVHRTLRSHAVPPAVVPREVAVSARGWPAWLADARDAASRHDWRDAVRLAYWAGISALESRQAWPADRARTPREYLRLLPRDHDCRAPLASLTSTFELVWYGHRDADAATFAEALTELERLGCRAA